MEMTGITAAREARSRKNEGTGTAVSLRDVSLLKGHAGRRRGRLGFSLRGADASRREGEDDEADYNAEPERSEADDDGGQGRDALAHASDDDLQEAGYAALGDTEAARGYEDDGAGKGGYRQDEGGLEAAASGAV